MKRDDRHLPPLDGRRRVVIDGTRPHVDGGRYPVERVLGDTLVEALGIVPGARFQVHDLTGDSRHSWQGPRAFVALDPQVIPAHIVRVRRHVLTEQTFEYCP